MLIKITCLAPSVMDSTSSPYSSGKGLNKNQHLENRCVIFPCRPIQNIYGIFCLFILKVYHTEVRNDVF